MNDKLYDAIRHVADLAADEYGLTEDQGDDLFEDLISEVEQAGEK